MGKSTTEKIQKAAIAYIKERNFHLTKEEVYEAIKMAIEEAFDRSNKTVIFDMQSMSVLELDENGVRNRSINWIFRHVDKRLLFSNIETYLDRYEREKIFAMFRVSKGQIIQAEAVGETFHLGSRARNLYPRYEFKGTVADFGLEKGIYVEGGKDAHFRLPLKDWKLWDIAKEIYDQTGYCMSINPHKKNLRLKKQPPAVLMNINGVEGIMPSDERIPGEDYIGKEWDVILYDINQTCREDFQLYVSRRQVAFLLKYIDFYLPGFSHSVKVKKVAREPGIMTKILIEKVDSTFKLSKYKDALFALMEALNGERIEFVQQDGDIESFIRSALNYHDGSLKVNIFNKTAVAITDEKGKVIGAKGVNVKLAGMLTDYKITVLTVDEYINGELFV